MGLRISGVEKFLTLARKLQELDDKELSARFYRAINSVSKPLIALVRQSASTILPKRGGLAKRVAGDKYRAFRNYRGASAGVQIVGSGDYDLHSINSGEVRHLTYGHKPLVSQRVQPLFFDQPLIDNIGLAKDALEKELDDIARKLES